MALENLTACPVCKGTVLTHFLVCKDHSISGENFTIQECTSCGLKFTNPRPYERDIGRYYQSEEYISHSNTSEGLVNKLYHQVRKITLNQKLRLVNSLAEKGTLLDVGCGTGYFLDVCKRDGWKVEGTEPDANARKLAEQQIGKEITTSVFNINKINYFNVITLWHVLEHIHNLNGTLIKISALLKSSGKLVIAVPNPDSWDAKHYHNYWAAYDVPRHLYHFNQSSINHLFENHHFRLIKTIPMKFDAFYVSMMSEKYKSGKNGFNLATSILNGWFSNIYGSYNNKNYSSIIYIAEKN